MFDLNYQSQKHIKNKTRDKEQGQDGGEYSR